MEQPPTYAWRCGSSAWRDYTYNKSTPNAEEEEEPPYNSRISFSKHMLIVFIEFFLMFAKDIAVFTPDNVS